MMPRDTEASKDATLGRDTARRVWTFARPYRGTIAIFLVAILVAALLALVPPLVTMAILDTAIPDKNKSLIVWLAGAAVAAALVDAALQIVQRWCAARVGEGLIADLRQTLVRQGAAAPDRVLHPHAHRCDHEPAQQRRGRRPDGGHEHARQRRQQRDRARHDADHHARARVAAHAARAGRAAAVHHPRQASRARACRTSHASRCSTTPR